MTVYGAMQQAQLNEALKGYRNLQDGGCNSAARVYIIFSHFSRHGRVVCDPHDMAILAQLNYVMADIQKFKMPDEPAPEKEVNATLDEMD